MSNRKTPSEYAAAILAGLVNFDLNGDTSSTEDPAPKTQEEFLRPVMRDLLASHIIQERKRGVYCYTVTREFAEFWLSETLDALIVVRPELTILTDAIAEVDAVREALLAQATYRMMLEMQTVLGYIKLHPQVSEIYFPRGHTLNEDQELKAWAFRQRRRA